MARGQSSKSSRRWGIRDGLWSKPLSPEEKSDFRFWQRNRPKAKPTPHKGAYVPPKNMTDMEKFVTGPAYQTSRLSHLDTARIVNRMRSESGESARVNAADVSMNNPRMWKDEAGHLWNPKTGKQLPHPTSHSHDVSVSNPPDWN